MQIAQRPLKVQISDFFDISIQISLIVFCFVLFFVLSFQNIYPSICPAQHESSLPTGPSTSSTWEPVVTGETGHWKLGNLLVTPLLSCLEKLDTRSFGTSWSLYCIPAGRN